MTLNQVTHMLTWANALPIGNLTPSECNWRVPLWINGLDEFLRLAGHSDRPCLKAAQKVDPEMWAYDPERNKDGRCNHRTAAAVWAAAVGEFRRIAEQHINQETTCRT